MVFRGASSPAGRKTHLTQRRSTVIIHTRLESAHLEGKLLGDPSERDWCVALPPGYGLSGQRYPTAHLVQAYGETAAQMVTPGTDGQR
jgi:hypothetical protein